MRKKDAEAARSSDPQRLREVESLAGRALAVLAARIAPEGGAALDEAGLSLLEEAAFEMDRPRRLAALDALQERGLTDEDIVDRYIPALARKLGDDWCDDRRSFAEVTIAVSRLQSMLRDIAVDWAQERPGAADAPEVLIVVRDQEYHTLGALIAATQFRRLGAATRIALGVTESEILAEALYGKADLVAISASSGENLDFIASLVKKLRSQADDPIIAVGGSVVSALGDVLSVTGADIVTADPREALALCELRRSNEGKMKAAARRPRHPASAP